MSRISVFPQAVPVAIVRRLSGRPAPAVPVQQVAVPLVPSPTITPRQIDPVGLRLMALQTEVDALRSTLQRTASD